MPSVVVQYQSSWNGLDKCQFREYIDDDLPRIHWYHNQTTYYTPGYTDTVEGTNGVNYAVLDGYFLDQETATPGPYSGLDVYNVNLTRYEQAPYQGPPIENCVYTNWYTGEITENLNTSDSRTWNGISGSADGCHTWAHQGAWGIYNYTADDPFFDPTNATWYLQVSESDSGGDNWSRDCDGSCTNPASCAYSNSHTYLQQCSIPPLICAWDSVTRTYATVTNMGTDYYSPTESFVWSGAYTMQLDTEYTDDELYANICGLLTPFGDGWSEDFQYAYSGIAADHADGSGVTDSGAAELGDLEYRFDVQGTSPRTEYQVTWDVVTVHAPLCGLVTVSTANQQANVEGNGGDVYVGQTVVQPPDWDESLCGGYVFVYVDNVQISIVKNKANSMPGTGPGWGLGAGGGGCSSCGGGGSGGNSSSIGAAYAQFNMGPASPYLSAGTLGFWSAQPSAALATPAALQLTVTTNAGVEVIQVSNQLRQVNAPLALADIVATNPYSYHISFYLPSQVGTVSNGVHQLSGTPYLSWQIANPDGAVTNNRLQLTETMGSQVSAYECDYYTNSSGGGNWKFEYPGALREDEVDTTYGTNAEGATTTVTKATRVPGGSDQYKIKLVYQTVCPPGGGVYPMGPYLVQKTVDPDNQPKTTTYTYNWYNYANGTTLPLDSITYPNGSWRKYGNFDKLGRPTIVYYPQQNSPLSSWNGAANYTYIYYDTGYVYGSGDDGAVSPNTPRSVSRHQNGAQTTTYTAFPSPYERLDVQCPQSGASWDDPGNLVTTTKYYSTGVNSNLVQSVSHPDGTMEIYTYAEALDGTQTNTVFSGQPNTGQTAIVDGTESVTVFGPVGQMVSQTTTDIKSGIITSREIYGDYDEFSRPQSVTDLDGASNVTEYACCGVDETIDPDGVTTSYQYDAAKRLVATTRLNITTTNVLDSAGHVLATLRIGSDNSVITQSQSAYDVSGTLIAQTNALGGVTAYGQTTNEFGGLIETTTNPDGGTSIQEYNLDGSLTNLTGTAVEPVTYVYGSASFNGANCFYSQEIKLNTDGTQSTEWTRNYTDPVGRPAGIAYAASGYTYPASHSYYNELGQLTNSVDPDGVSTLCAYNGKGEQIFSAIDMDQDGVIDFAGSDRITWTTNDVVSDHGTYVQRTQTFVWDTFGANTPKLVSCSESSVDGLQSWQITCRDASVAVTNHSQTVYGSGGARTETSTAPDGSQTISAYSYGQLISVTRKDSTGVQLGQTTYAYDAHGRQHSVADARNGATVYSYNNADMPFTVTTPNPGPGGLPETTTTYYDASLRATNVVQPDGTSVISLFYPNGQLQETYGSRTYPVAYTYDYAGRMKTMTTWQNFNAGTGAAVTTWNYDPYQGLLTGKAYADGNGPTYAYTPAGRLATRTWARSVNGSPLVTAYVYDTAGALTNVNYSDGTTPAVGTVYDRLGRATTIYQGSLVTSDTYNLADQLLRESYAGGPLNGQWITNIYDADLRRTNLMAHVGTNVLTTAYGYDNASRLLTVNDGNNNVATYSYLANSPLVSQITFTQNGAKRMTTTKQYDYLNRLTQISSQPSASGTLPISYSYNYNAANQRTRNTFADGSHWVYQYDWLGQVTNGARLWNDGTPVAGQQYQYAFDTIGNRTQTWSGGDTNGLNLRVANYTVNSLNQYTQRGVPGTNDIVGVALIGTNVTVNGVTADRKGEYFHGAVGTNNASHAAWLNVGVVGALNTVTGNLFVAQSPEHFQYDLDGNLTNDGRWAYIWDGENRLIGMTVNTNAGPQYQLTFVYDSKGRRTQKIVATNYVAFSTNNFLYDGWNLVVETAPNSSLVRNYVWGNDLSGSPQGAGGVGGLLEVSYHGGSVTNGFVAYDGNANVAWLVNAADGTVLASYEYGPFGEAVRSTGPLAKNNPVRFSTKYQDDESDLVYYGYRYYKASTGEWLSRDPVDECGFNRLTIEAAQDDSIKSSAKTSYTFLSNAPFVAVDALGLQVLGLNDVVNRSAINRPAGLKDDITVCVMVALLWKESSFNTLAATPPPNTAKGIAQINNPTANFIQDRLGPEWGGSNPFDTLEKDQRLVNHRFNPDVSIFAAYIYLDHLERVKGSLLAALQHYGPNALHTLIAAECLCTKCGGLYGNPKTGDVNVVNENAAWQCLYMIHH